MTIDVIVPHVSFLAIESTPVTSPQRICTESLSPHSNAFLDVDTMRSAMHEEEEEDVNMFKAVQEKVDDGLSDQTLLELDIPLSKELVNAIVSSPFHQSVDVVSNSF
jgi:hypothetical protein